MSGERAGAGASTRSGPARPSSLTGGHREEAVDLFFDGERLVEIPGERFESGAAHGSGCTHSSALAAHLALGLDPLDAARAAKAIASEAVRDGLRDRRARARARSTCSGSSGACAAARSPRPARRATRARCPAGCRRTRRGRRGGGVAGVVVDLVAAERQVRGHRDGHHHGGILVLRVHDGP